MPIGDPFPNITTDAAPKPQAPPNIKLFPSYSEQIRIKALEAASLLFSSRIGCFAEDVLKAAKEFENYLKDK